jgi:hypothetical protein
MSLPVKRTLMEGGVIISESYPKQAFQDMFLLPPWGWLAISMIGIVYFLKKYIHVYYGRGFREFLDFIEKEKAE